MKNVYEEPIIMVLDIEDVVTSQEIDPPSGGGWGEIV